MSTANFTKPVVGDLRADVLQYIRDAMAAQARLFDGDTLVSQPTGTIRFNAANGRFEKWGGASWAELALTSLGNSLSINTGASQPLALQTSSATPWGLELRRTDAAFSSRLRNTGARLDFEHRPSFAGNLALDAANVGSYAPALTGTGASGTWGISVTGSAASAGAVAWAGITGAPAITGMTADVAASGDTVVRRNSSGYVFAAYLNQSSGADENPAISQFMVTNSSDSYLRKASVGTVATALNATIAPVFTNLTSRPTTVAGYGITDIGSYAPTKTGGGASGTWGINITGNAATATTATSATTATNVAGGGTVAAATAVFSGVAQATAFVASSGSGGRTEVVNGNSDHTGYLSFYNTAGTREGYIGFATTTGGGDGGTIPFTMGTAAFTGNVTAASFSGPLTGNVTGNAATASAVAWSGVTGRPINSITVTTSTATPTGGAAGDIVFQY